MKIEIDDSLAPKIDIDEQGGNGAVSNCPL